MFFYWLLYLTPAVVAVSSPGVLRSDAQIRGWPWAWWVTTFLLTAVIGLRYNVGGDWYPYVGYFQIAQGMTILEAIRQQDPAYWVLNVIVANMDLGLTGVNLISGLMFSAGLTTFCLTLPRPWLALAAAVPYLIIVVAMGYTRQSVALGFALMGLAALGKGRIKQFVALVVMGTLFHKSAVLLLPIAGLSAARNRLTVMISTAIAFVILYVLFVKSTASEMISEYVDQNIRSSGALIRLAMNAVPGAIFILLRKKMFLKMSSQLWLIVSIISIGMFGAVFFTHISTALDRVALYLLPVQLVVATHLPNIFSQEARDGTARISVVLLQFSIIVYYAVVLFLWLNFGDNSWAWQPYQIGFY